MRPWLLLGHDATVASVSTWHRVTVRIRAARSPESPQSPVTSEIQPPGTFFWRNLTISACSPCRERGRLASCDAVEITGTSWTPISPPGASKNVRCRESENPGNVVWWMAQFPFGGVARVGVHSWRPQPDGSGTGSGATSRDGPSTSLTWTGAAAHIDLVQRKRFASVLDVDDHPAVSGGRTPPPPRPDLDASGVHNERVPPAGPAHHRPPVQPQRNDTRPIGADSGTRSSPAESLARDGVMVWIFHESALPGPVLATHGMRLVTTIKPAGTLPLRPPRTRSDATPHAARLRTRRRPALPRHPARRRP